MNRILFGKDKNGGYKEWQISVVDNVITITHGKEGGKMQTKRETIKGKNIGRVNETTPEQQALLEAESRYKKQLDKGYRENKEDLEDLEILPMLASDYRKQGHRIKYPCFGLPKYDGARCLAIRHADRVELKSRGGKQYTVHHIQEALMRIMREGDMYDGELYIHGLPLEHITSAVKKPNENTPRLQFIIFDIVDERTYEHRLIALQAMRRYTLSCIDAPHIHVAPFCEVQDEQHMKEMHGAYVQDGYEGIMLRNYEGVYESGKRSADLQKYKEFHDEEFQIVGVHQDRNGNAILEVFDSLANANFTVCYGSFEERKYQLEHPEEFIGKWLTVHYQTRYADSRLPQFPVGKLIREGKAVGGEFKPEI